MRRLVHLSHPDCPIEGVDDIAAPYRYLLPRKKSDGLKCEQQIKVLASCATQSPLCVRAITNCHSFRTFVEVAI
jgi:hypothetical protein